MVPPHPDYAELAYAWRNQRHTLLHNPIQDTTLEKVREALSGASQTLDLEGAHRWFIKAGDVVVGTVSLSNINSTMGLAEIGYMIGEEHYGHGYAREGTRLWIEKIFRETALRKLLAYVAEDNLPSHRVVERLGFVREGLLREHYLIRGQPVNEVLWGLLRPKSRFRA